MTTPYNYQTCSICDDPYHLAYQCPYDRCTPTCSICDDPYHLAYQCPYAEYTPTYPPPPQNNFQTQEECCHCLSLTHPPHECPTFLFSQQGWIENDSSFDYDQPQSPPSPNFIPQYFHNTSSPTYLTHDDKEELIDQLSELHEAIKQMGNALNRPIEDVESIPLELMESIDKEDVESIPLESMESIDKEDVESIPLELIESIDKDNFDASFEEKNFDCYDNMYCSSIDVNDSSSLSIVSNESFGNSNDKIELVETIQDMFADNDTLLLDHHELSIVCKDDFASSIIDLSLVEPLIINDQKVDIPFFIFKPPSSPKHPSLPRFVGHILKFWKSLLKLLFMVASIHHPKRLIHPSHYLPPLIK